MTEFVLDYQDNIFLDKNLQNLNVLTLLDPSPSSPLSMSSDRLVKLFCAGFATLFL